jgi:acyl carrier protein
VTPEAIRREVLAALGDVAPDVDPTGLTDDRPLREQVDIDSYDFLQFLVRIHERLGVDVPERDYGEIETLSRLVAYLAARRPAAG